MASVLILLTLACFNLLFVTANDYWRLPTTAQGTEASTYHFSVIRSGCHELWLKSEFGAQTSLWNSSSEVYDTWELARGWNKYMNPLWVAKPGIVSIRLGYVPPPLSEVFLGPCSDSLSDPLPNAGIATSRIYPKFFLGSLQLD